MIQKNRINPVITQTTTKNSLFIDSAKTNYQDWGNSIIEPSTMETTVGSFPTETRLQYSGYDNKGNPLSVSKANDVQETYIWGYNNSYPVAKIIGTDYSTVISYVNQSIVQNPTSDQQLRDEINKVRTGLQKAKVFVTTYTYAPLVGITSQTDASNRTTYYEYDGLSRLKIIRDLNNNIVKAYDYQYKSNGTVVNYFNDSISLSYNRNSCPLNTLAGSYTTIVNANTYTSTLSKDDANQQAWNYIYANGQANANTYGTCTPAGSLILMQCYSSNGIPVVFNFTNLGTNQIFTFQTTGYFGTIGSIPAGIYNILITCPTLYGGPFSYILNAYRQSSVIVGSINNISLTQGATIEVY
jgi:YD repeat-containing protein